MPSLEDRMKEFENIESNRRFQKGLPVCVRIDGKGFSKFTNDLEKPFDTRFSRCMIGTTKQLVSISKPIIGYTQSDEISLVFYQDRSESQIFCDGKVMKLTSLLASIATSAFFEELEDEIPEKAARGLPNFDCRVWTVPSPEEAVNMLLWRQRDAIRNSVSMAARAIFSHHELHKKNTREMLEMMHSKGVEWEDYSRHSRRGTFVKREVYEEVNPTPEDLAHIPEEHRPKGPIKRSRIVEVDIELSKTQNRIGLIFGEKEQNVA